MAITYTVATNIVTIVGYTEATPCNFTDIYNADKAGTLSLHARTGITAVDGAAVATDRAERPADYIVLGGASNDLYITIANWVGTTATIQITGTDRDGTAQTEDIVVTANGNFYTTKWFKTITHTQVTVFTATGFDYDLTQGQWGVAWKEGSTAFYFESRLDIGDGTITTYFADTKKIVEFATGLKIDIKAPPTYFTLGTLINETDKTSKDGCTIIFDVSGNNYGFYANYPDVKIYSSTLISKSGGKIGNLQGTPAFRIWNSMLIGWSKGFQGWAHAGGLGDDFYRVNIQDCDSGYYAYSEWFSFTRFEDVLIAGGTNGIYFQELYSFHNIIVRNLKVRGATYDFRLEALYDDQIYAINCDINWNLNWVDDYGDNFLYRQYELDLKVIDKDNTPIQTATIKIWDKDSNLIVDTTTDANGDIATQTISRGYYNQANLNTLQEYSPHLITIEKAGYTTYEADFTLGAKTDWTVALQGVLKRNPAMTGGMV